jgi:hypothetical protein
MTGLIIDMFLLIMTLTDKEMEVIGTPRDNQRRNVNQLFHYGAMGTGVVVGTMMGGPLLR